MQPIFITGIGTDVGKTVVAAIVTEALQADYWKPVQAGYDDGTDSEWVNKMLSNQKSNIHPETYKLKTAASPHLAAKEEGVVIDLNKIVKQYNAIEQIDGQQTSDDRQRAAANYKPQTTNYLTIEGAGGLLVPLNEKEFVLDLIKKLKAKVILVSRNYLGSINHSLLTAKVCRQNKLEVIGWIFNDNYMHYEEQIVNWSGYPKIGSVDYVLEPDKTFIKKNAAAIQSRLMDLL